MNKQELIKEFREIGIYNLSIFGTEIKGIPTESAITLIEQLDEPEKVKVPQFVADWIEEARKACKDVVDFFEFNFTNDEVGKWFMQELPFDLAARAWLDGYEVEKEKRYTVVMKATKQPLYYNAMDKKLFFSMGGLATKFTRKQLEEAGVGWVFDCEGIEIEEVE
ncbi:phage protein [Streptococcus pneumoniae]|uniref:DUF1642 domain-containing protein n=1 Tax=Streptococcus pneumoniae TaxID=1313 RepID=UPI000845F993|nr:DUF1642 domain-containing protein [Streptococcus pneumoniae]ODO47512.1 hypothetical protein A5N48_05895 [Streptococcus pneumoniae]TVW09589.1 DUF1642 domain-containing protein [Streptococcus pneumoniae]VIW06294.1 phage protein [Streptococcus pneumoniae]VJV29387.1 phage protein [Streptococcus pneumoniae]VKA83052.1 phage protein [Streptococcus pneumoniae]